MNSSQTARPMAAGSRNSAQSCQIRTSGRRSRFLAGFLAQRGTESAIASWTASPRMARTISSLPLRSAIRMVAELMPLVDCSSRLRSVGGTSVHGAINFRLVSDGNEDGRTFQRDARHGDLQPPARIEAASGSFDGFSAELSFPACSNIT